MADAMILTHAILILVLNATMEVANMKDALIV
jgi:hypothetical protein